MSKAATEDDKNSMLTVMVHEECVNCDHHRCLREEEVETIFAVCPHCEHNISPTISVMPTSLRLLPTDELVEGITKQADYFQTLQEQGWEPVGCADGPTVSFKKTGERTQSDQKTMEVPLPE